MSTTQNGPPTQLALKRELKVVCGPMLKQCDQPSPVNMRQAELLPRKRLVHATPSPQAARRSGMQPEEPNTVGNVITKDLQRRLYPSQAPSGTCPVNYLRIPFDGLSTRSSGMGGSTVSLLVHAPSVSRMSGQIDDEDNSSFSAEANMTPSIPAPKGNVDLSQVRHGCLVCQLGLIGKKRTVNTELRKKHVSISAINVFSLSTDIQDITKGYYVPALCTLHKELGWNADSLSEAVDLYRVLNPSKFNVLSVSLPDLYRTTQESYLNDIPDEPTELNIPMVPHHTSDQVTGSPQEKCKHWLDDLGMS